MTRITMDSREMAAGLLVGLLVACGGADGGAASKPGVSPQPSSPSTTSGNGVGALSWSPPAGIPTPPFGVAEAAPALPEPWSAVSTSSAGFSLYYVCPSCPGATDSGNSNGYPGNPRASIPSLVSGPAVVVLDGSFDEAVSFNGSGTASAPVFVTSRDPSRPARIGALEGRGAFVIFEHLWIGPRDAADSDFGFFIPEGAHHVALRRSELAGNSRRSGGIAVGSWDYRGTASASQIVIDANYVHDLGDLASPGDEDTHCVALTGSADHVWVTHNRLERCSGDAIQVEAQAGRRAAIHHVYYGANRASDNRQSGGWVKNATDVIFSQNVSHDFGASSGGPGSCYGFQYDAEYVWFLFNEGYRCAIGINIAGSSDDPGKFAYVIGNVLHDIHAPTTDPYESGAMVIRGSTNVFVVNNTMYDVDSGINMPPGTRNVYYTNNIIAGRLRSGTYDLYTEGGTNVDARNNIFGSNARFTDGPGVSAYLGDPKLVSPATGDFRLQAGSPAVEAGIPSSAYEAFSSRYGLSIAVDHGGQTRPAGQAWDVGAFEFTPGAATRAR